MLFDILKNTIKIFFQFFSFLIIPSIIIIIIFTILLFYWYLYFTVIKKMKRKPMTYFYKTTPIYKRIFYQLPKQLMYDFITQDPDAFGEFGIHMFCGEQGSGKTVTLVYMLEKWRRMYPKLKIYTNMAYKYEDDTLEHWHQLIERNNGIYGVANVIDEIQTWFSSAESKDVPPSMLGEISQQRKQKKAILGTAQVFGRIAKPFREQVHFVYLPKTYCNCLTIVRKAKAVDYDPETGKFKKWQGFFFFVHTKELREAYDTFKRISKYSDTEFAGSIYSGTAPTAWEGSGE